MSLNKIGYTTEILMKDLDLENIKYFIVTNEDKLTKGQIKLLTKKICEA